MMSKKLLLVEKSMAIQKLVELALAKEAIEVVTVSNGLSALDILAQVPPDLLLIDSQMEGMNVQSFLEKIRASGKVKSPPILLLTEPEDLMETDALLESGVRACIEKPFEAGSLRDKVVDVLQINTQGQVSQTAQQVPQAAAPEVQFGGDPEETMVASFSGSPSLAPSLMTQGDISEPKIEDLLGWASEDEKSPFSELEDEKPVDDLGDSLAGAKGEDEGKVNAVVIDDEPPVVTESFDLLQEQTIVSPPEPAKRPDPDPEPVSLESLGEEPSPYQPQEPVSRSAPVVSFLEEAPSSAQRTEASSEESSPSSPEISLNTLSAQSQDPVVFPKGGDSSSQDQGEIQGISPEQLEAIVSKISREVIEKVVWEVVPSMAEIAIQKEIERLKGEDPS